jgi:hypothetical protein
MLAPVPNDNSEPPPFFIVNAVNTSHVSSVCSSLQTLLSVIHCAARDSKRMGALGVPRFGIETSLNSAEAKWLSLHGVALGVLGRSQCSAATQHHCHYRNSRRMNASDNSRFRNLSRRPSSASTSPGILDMSPRCLHVRAITIFYQEIGCMLQIFEELHSIHLGCGSCFRGHIRRVLSITAVHYHKERRCNVPAAVPHRFGLPCYSIHRHLATCERDWW